LQKGAKYSLFDQHRQFLPLDHPFRQDKKNFTKGLVVTQHMWSHKSGLQRLLYHDDLIVPHHIDFMHTEKNIAEALFCTLMDTDKSKDNRKARVDITSITEILKSNVVGRASRGAGSTSVASRPTSTGAGSAARVFPVTAGNGE
jgi:hypothetical protein